MVLPWQMLACAYEAVRGTEEKTSAQPNANLAVLIEGSNSRRRHAKLANGHLA